jgi:RNA polymerase sigma factor (TIGR02999 family)
MNDVTRVLGALDAGDPQAAAQLLPLVYDELRRIAAARMAQEKPGQTLDATGLVHEAYLRLVGNQKFASRGHFFAAAAEAMRRILVESARRRKRLKRGGAGARVDLDLSLWPAEPDASRLIELSEALDALETRQPEAAQVVKLRYFAGLSIEEAALALGISVRTTNRHWSFARAWLFERLRPSGTAS